MSVLDEEYHKDRPLNINAEQREFLTVNEQLWQETVYAYERKFNLGCVGWWFLFFVLLMSGGLISPWIYPLMIITGFVAKALNSRRCKNLYWHAHFDYEFGLDRIVRYENTSYTIFLFDEIKYVKEFSFGLIVRKKYHWLDAIHLSMLSYKNPDLLVVPKDTMSYQKIVDFVKQKST